MGIDASTAGMDMSDKDAALSEVAEFTYDTYLGGDGHFTMLDFIDMALDAAKRARGHGASEAEVQRAEELGKSRWRDEVKRRTGIVLGSAA